MNSHEDILKKYNIGDIKNINPINIGFIHNTWHIQTSEGDFILQKVNPIYIPEVMEDIEAVLTFLQKNGHVVAKIVRTQNNNLCVNEEKGFWRIFTYLEGRVYEVATEKVAFEAGKILGKYHNDLSKFKYDFKHSRPIKNNAPLIYKAYKDSIKNRDNPEINRMLPIIDKMVDLELPSNLRKTINHGDPKISNFIFTEDGKVVMIDFDDCGKNYNVVHELASAFRSWCCENGDKFNLEFYKAGFQGYLEGSNQFLNENECNLITQAIKLNILQLASRFIRDYFEGSYFKWDSAKYKSHKEQSIERAKEHIQYYEDVCQKETEINQITLKLFKDFSKAN